MTTRSPFAQALYNLLTCDPKMTMKHWALWLNPSYTERNPNGGAPEGRSLTGGPPVWDIFEQPTEEEMRTVTEEFHKNWVPCHEVGIGITIQQIEGWTNDIEMPSPKDLNMINGYIQFMEDTPARRTAVEAFHQVLTTYAGNVTPHGRAYAMVPYNFGTIGARMVIARYGVICGLLDLPPDRWDFVFNEIARLKLTP